METSFKSLVVGFVGPSTNPAGDVGGLRLRSMMDGVERMGGRVKILAPFDPTKKSKIYQLAKSLEIFFRILILPWHARVFAGFGPFWTIPALWLALILRWDLKLQSDFRDGWSAHYRNSVSIMRSLRGLTALFVERSLAWRSERFIVSTPGLWEYYLERGVKAEKLRLVLNGHEVPEELRRLQNSQLGAKKKWKWVCLGKFFHYSPIGAGVFFHEMSQLRRKFPDLELEIIFVNSEEPELRNLGKEFAIEDLLIFLPAMEYRWALQLAASCDFGLTLLRDEDLEFGTKAFDYVGLGLPIWDLFSKQGKFYQQFKSALVHDLQPRKVPVELSKKFHRQVTSQGFMGELFSAEATS